MFVLKVKRDFIRLLHDVQCYCRLCSIKRFNVKVKDDSLSCKREVVLRTFSVVSAHHQNLLVKSW